MNEQQLSERLKRVADHLLRGKALADIGSDHAYLPCYAYLKGLVPFAIAGDLNEGPYLSAKSRVAKAGLTAVISVRKGDGLAVIHSNEVRQVTIAGMGGGLITGILTKGKHKLEGVERLILQPNIATEKVRRWLYCHRWQLIQEDILEEDERIYEILVAAPGENPELYKNNDDPAFLFGPYLMKKRAKAFRKKWALEKEKKIRILQRLEQATSTKENEKKKKEVKQQLRMIEEAIS